MNRSVSHFYPRLSAFICGFAVLFLFASAIADQVAEDPLERQMLDIAKDLRCAVCQNQPISESNADLARDMREVIREQLKAGKSRAEIVRYFVDRYGNYVLMKPPYEGTGAPLWALPLAIFLVLAASAWVFLKRRLRAPMPPPPELTEPDPARVRAARKHSRT